MLNVRMKHMDELLKLFHTQGYVYDETFKCYILKSNSPSEKPLISSDNTMFVLCNTIFEVPPNTHTDHLASYDYYTAEHNRFVMKDWVNVVDDSNKTDPDIDDKVIVWDEDVEHNIYTRCHGHFAGFREGKPTIFSDGRSSFTILDTDKANGRIVYDCWSKSPLTKPVSPDE